MYRSSVRASVIAALAIAAASCITTVFVEVDGQPPDTIAILLDSAVAELVTIDVGQTASLSASGITALGFVIDIDDVTWNSTQPLVASVDGSGRMRGHSPGTTVVSASVQVDTITVVGTLPAVINDTTTVFPDPDPDPDPPPPPPPPPPSPGDWSFNNIPSGMPMIDSNNFTELRAPGWDIAFNQSDRSPEIVNIPTPVDNSVIRQWWSGVPDSWSPHYPYLRTPQLNEAFFGVIFRLSPEWDWGTGNGWSKWFTVLSGAGNAWWGFVGPGGIGRNPTQRGQTEAPGFSHQWTSGTRDTQTFTQPWFDNGEWVKLEMYINLRPGEERVRAWMNDVLVLDGVPDWGGSTPPIGELKLGSTLGGGSGLPTLDVRYYADYALVETYGR